MERDNCVVFIVADAKISTHTLTWSVTCRYRHFYAVKFISTHTLTWSVTDIMFDFSAATPISTHTLTWSVTKKAKNWLQISGFQLTRSRGA